MAKHKARVSNAGLLGLPTHETNRFLKKQGTSRGFVKSAVLYSSLTYVLYWILYACPTGVPSPEDPAICYTYNSAKHSIVNNVVPILQPYYEQYASPYLAKGQPYYDQANALYSQYGSQAVKKTGYLYSSHVHPSVLKTTSHAKNQFSSKIAPLVEPHVSRLQSQTSKLYQQYLGKHVATLQANYDHAIEPYLTYAKDKSVEVYTLALPYLSSAAGYASCFYTSHVHPRIIDFLSWVYHFGTTRILPTIRRFYLLKIEPQINKLSCQLFHFNVSSGFALLDKTSADSLERSVSESILSSVTFATRVESTVIAGETHTIANPAPTIDAKTQAAIDHQVIDDLLAIAESNIALEGSAAEAALADKLEEILPSLVKKEEILCKDYLTQLESVTVDEVAAIENRIVSSAQKNSNEVKFTEEISEELRPYFVKAGKNVHGQAVEVKAHLSTVLDSLQIKIQKATYLVYSHVQTVAQDQKKQPEEKIRYYTEKATKKELRRLDALNDQIKAIEKQLNAVADKKLKDYTKQLKSLIKETEHKVEQLAGGAAKKLQTLHSIGPKKIVVGDDSNQFGHGYLPVGAILGAQAIYNQLSTGVFGAPEPTPELPERILESAKSVASSLSANINSDSVLSIAAKATSIASGQGGNAASALSQAAMSAGSAFSALSEAAPSVDLNKVQSKVEVAQSYVGEQAADIVAVASEAVYGTPQALTESIQSRVSEAIYGTPEPLTSSVVNRVNEALSAASDKVNSAMHGTAVTLSEKIVSKASSIVHGSETPLAQSVAHKVEDAFRNAKDKVADLVHDGETLISKKSSSASSLAKSLSSVASASFASLEQAASAANSVASASRESAAKAAASESATFVDKAWEDYANAKSKVKEVVSDVRDRVEL